MTKGNNPKGNPSTLRAGNPKDGVSLGAAVRVRMPSEETAAALIERLEKLPRTKRAEELGRLLTLGLQHS
jgi:hypothetical protein